MRRLISTLTVIWAMGGGMAWAQAFPPNETGVTNGHWHLNTRDIEANKKIFVTLGGTAQKAGNFDVVRFPGVVVYLHQNNAPPPTGGTVGSVVNHVGFIVPNTQQAVAKWKAAGIEGAARQQRQDGSGICRNAGQVADRDPGGQEPEDARSSTTTSISTCRSSRSRRSRRGTPSTSAPSRACAEISRPATSRART